MQKICLTEQSFSEIRKAGGLYVDKTKHIYDLFRWDKYFFIARPRRFGKSLLCSTLAELFANNRALFKNTWIDNSDWQWDKYPVIHLDMGFAVSATGNTNDIRQKLTNILFEIAKKYSVELINTPDPGETLRQLITNIKASTGKPVVVIIDEYDKPLLDAIDKTDKFPAIHEELRTFYSPLKLLSAELKFVFITGVFKFAKTSIFSGFNNLKDITFSISAATLCGYTEQEIKTFFSAHLEALAKKNNVSLKAMMFKLQEQYNGYTFGVDVDTKQLAPGVYNPFALNYAFSEQQLLHKWFSSGSPTALIKKLAAEQFEELDPQELSIDFETLDDSCNPGDMTALCLLYYAGYITIKHYVKSKVHLDFPSLEVAQAFAKNLLPLLLQKGAFATTRLLDKIRDLFVEHRLEDLKNLLNDALAPVAYPTLTKPQNDAPQEHLYQIAFYYLFIGSKMPTSLEDMTNRGRIDIIVQLPTSIYVFELKMNEPAAVAIQQIKDKDYGAKFRHHGKKIYAIGISVSSQKRFVQELVWEAL
ncbi:hypothetical protein FJ365_03190 [Candidatus Dependentiae bacterium]|nr:hypothetical protein [Candidatus Dependentiae bacterium]